MGPTDGSRAFDNDASRFVSVFLRTSEPVACGDSRLITAFDFEEIVFWPNEDYEDRRAWPGAYENCQRNEGRRCAWGYEYVDNMLRLMPNSTMEDLVIDSVDDGTVSGHFSRDGATVRFDAPFCFR